MKKIFIVVTGFLLLMSCGSENENAMYVKGNIKGLVKGTLYLQKQIDSLIVSVDSLKINGTSEFLLSDIIETPEMYYLALGNSTKKIPFFGEKDSITINSSLDKFELKAVVIGSENHDILEEYLDFKGKFNDKNLDLIKKEFEIKMSENQDSMQIVQDLKNGLLKRRYLFTINYAINNANFEAAPYIALTELQNTNIKMLDTINNSLSPEIKTSKYGKELNEFILRRKGEGSASNE